MSELPARPGGPSLLSAPDKFRGSLSGERFCAASAAACEQMGWSQQSCRLSDGGEGFGELLGEGGEEKIVRVSGPLGSPVRAPLFMSGRRGAARAVIESRTACGLLLAGGADRNRPMEATTKGVGELIMAASEMGASEILLGCGGSASTDGGRGALEAMGLFPPGGPLPVRRLLVAYDVTTPFLRAAEVFGPQKGASPDQVLQLSHRLEELAGLYRETGSDVTSLEGAGAAGGLAGGLAAAGAELVSGFEVSARASAFPAALAAASAVVTGEGRLDATSLEGKVTGSVVRAAAGRRRPCLVVVGQADEHAAALAGQLGAVVVSLEERFGAERSRRETAELVTEVVAEWLSALEPRPEGG